MPQMENQLCFEKLLFNYSQLQPLLSVTQSAENTREKYNGDTGSENNSYMSLFTEPGIFQCF